eukprot:7590423-Alexandrium_andersonii.AAC.1
MAVQGVRGMAQRRLGYGLREPAVPGPALQPDLRDLLHEGQDQAQVGHRGRGAPQEEASEASGVAAR